MSFPIDLRVRIMSSEGTKDNNIILRGGLTTLVGPNGSGKTHLLREIKNTLASHPARGGKKIRFLSAGRMGMLEQWRSDYRGTGGRPQYDNANFGSKSDVGRRHQTETLNGDFQTLSERPDILIKVQERLKKLFKRDLTIDWNGGHLKVVFSRVNREYSPYPSGKEASGLLHLVGILAALYDDEVGVLLLDEPEVSQHPQLQAFLLNEIRSVAGHPNEGGFQKIVIMATHSTEMLKISKPEDLSSIIFCHNLETTPIQIAPDAEELKNKKLRTLITKLGQEHKLSLFSSRPLLVEGPSDVTICSFLSNKLEFYIEAAGVQILPVTGKGQMPVVAKFMKMLGKIPIVLADADAIADDLKLINYYLSNSEIADEKAAELGAPSAVKLASSTHSDFCKIVETKWEEISRYAEKHPYWINKKEESDNLGKKRSCFSLLFEMDEKDIRSLTSGTEWLRIKTRLNVILELLEGLGCFILRKGAIESYYKSSDQYTSEAKPSAAFDEISYLEETNVEEIKANLGDVVRCVEFASLGESINEVESLRDILLSVAAPATGKLNSATSTSEVKGLARTILREKDKIFDFSVENNQLTITLNSEILDVDGFPIVINQNDDVIKVVENQLKRKA